jgi:hypothetical protein
MDGHRRYADLPRKLCPVDQFSIARPYGNGAWIIFVSHDLKVSASTIDYN